jgi:hypothetical protein
MARYEPITIIRNAAMNVEVIGVLKIRNDRPTPMNGATA